MIKRATRVKKSASYPKPKGFDPDDDSQVLIGSRFRGLSAQLGHGRPRANANRKRKPAATKARPR